MWLNLGIKSEIGRDATTFNMFDWAESKRSEGKLKGNLLPSDTSIFDPVLCEIVYKWFSNENSKILDPFAGGSVRGIVASCVNRNYIGVDLSTAQIEANKKNASEVIGQNYQDRITWINDDSNNIDKHIDDESMDLIFSCPPYFNLEVYSDKENDLSNMDWESFKVSYKSIITKCCNKLKGDRFACFVVGDIRDKGGAYLNLVDYTKQCFLDNGLVTWNELILYKGMATAGLRAEKPFKTNRKIIKVHQNVLIFYKGDPKKIKDNFGEAILD